MSKKRIAVIGTVGIPAKYGGFETLAEHLTREIGDAYDFTVYCSSKSYEEKQKTHNGARLKYLPLQANGFQSIAYDILSIFHALRYADTLLILGVSGCAILPVVKLLTKKHIIVNIDGLEWKRDKWGRFAKWFLKFSEGVAVRNADVVVGDNKVIQEYIKAAYGKDASLIAYGADHVEKHPLNAAVLAQFPFLKTNYAFKVCRIEPENNIGLILEAFSKFRELNLVIIGNWNNSEYAQGLRSQYQGFENIFLLDPIYDQYKLNQIRSNCYVYVHGHSAGGTNPSLVEAMYLGLPIIAFGIDYNRHTTAHKAIYFEDAEELQKLLQDLEALGIEEVGTQMFATAKEAYRWPQIASQYERIF